MKLVLKGCPKCGGDVEHPRIPTPFDDPTCIQCGFYICETTLANLAKGIYTNEPGKVKLYDESASLDNSDYFDSEAEVEVLV